MDKAIECVVKGCTSYAALSQTPQARIEQSSCEPPDAVGISFAAYVLKRSRQLILVLRESATSYTSAMVIKDERHHALRDALVRVPHQRSAALSFVMLTCSPVCVFPGSAILYCNSTRVLDLPNKLLANENNNLYGY